MEFMYTRVRFCFHVVHREIAYNRNIFLRWHTALGSSTGTALSGLEFYVLVGAVVRPSEHGLGLSLYDESQKSADVDYIPEILLIIRFPFNIVPFAQEIIHGHFIYVETYPSSSRTYLSSSKYA
jgi:hypothetical protein